MKDLHDFFLFFFNGIDASCLLSGNQVRLLYLKCFVCWLYCVVGF